MSAEDVEDAEDAEDDAPPKCPRCGGVHATMHDPAWPDADPDEEYPPDS